MKLSLFHWLFTLCWAVTLLSGCHKKNEDPTPATTGIAGTVTVVDQSGQALLKSGVTVTVLNTTPLLTATTNDAGEFIIGAVPAGTYTLTFSRAGISTFVLRGVAHPQAAVMTYLPEVYKLMEQPTNQATALKASNLSAGSATSYVLFETTLTTPQAENDHDYILYFGSASTVSLITATGSLHMFSSGSTATTTSLRSWAMDRDDFLKLGVNAPKGTTMYAVAHGTNHRSSYTDLITGLPTEWPNPNLTPSPVVSFTMP